MIDSGSRSQVRPLESFKRSRFGLLAIASFIIHCWIGELANAMCGLTQQMPVASG